MFHWRSREQAGPAAQLSQTFINPPARCRAEPKLMNAKIIDEDRLRNADLQNWDEQNRSDPSKAVELAIMGNRRAVMMLVDLYRPAVPYIDKSVGRRR